MNELKLRRIPFGGDYSPEQWSHDVWKEDMKLMKELGVNTVTINVHSWIMSEREEGRIDFAFLDDVVAMLKENDIDIIMATATTAPPAWMYQKDHGILKTDIKGRASKYGVRERFCPTSVTYRQHVEKFVSALAEHFKDEKSILLWHLNNELSGFCYCEHCEQRFRNYLKEKYGTIENLNERWCTAMWGRTYTSFDDIYAPTELNELYLNVNGDGMDLDSLPTEAIEYARFQSEAHRELFDLETQCIRKFIPDAVCTNNYQFRGRFDYHRIADPIDIISLDIYPEKTDPSYKASFNLDIARNFKKQDTPFLIMEMTPNHASWAKVCASKRPGEIGLYAMTNIAHGADSALFFQIRRTPAGFEKFHGAMIAHVGHLDTRIGRELKALSHDLCRIPLDILGMTLSPEVAVIHDWDEKLGVEIPCSVQKGIDYTKEVMHYYRFFHENNIATDVISLDQDFSKYKLIVAPMLCMLRGEYAEKLRTFTESGGILVLTYFSGYTDECDYMYLDGQPGPLKDVAGLWVEEIDALSPGESNRMVFHDGTSVSVSYMCDVIRDNGAEVLAVYGDDYYEGLPCLTRNRFGKGECIYIGAKPDSAGVDRILSIALSDAGITRGLDTPEGVRAVRRGDYLFLLNYSGEDRTVTLQESMLNVLSDEKTEEVFLPPNGYCLLK